MNVTDECLKSSLEIYRQAKLEYPPFATVLMFSGGDDSLTALHIARALGIQVDYVMHVNTRTGIAATTEYVRALVADLEIPYIEMDAGEKYERYVLRKGFFGKGIMAHAYAYHILKKDQFERGLSSIRNRKPGRKILLLNGGRRQEGKNRMVTMVNPIKADGSNIWVNIINEWTKIECMDFLHDCRAQRNPVTELLHRSGECMCGTMQSLEARKEAAFWFPEWGTWLDTLEKRVKDQGFWWGWGEGIPHEFSMMKKGQMFLPSFQPMCIGCTVERE